MQVEIFRKKILKTISSIFIIFIFSTNVALSTDQIFTRIQEYLLGMRTLQANFSQINSMGDIMTGKLYLKKPGKIRFSYDPPHNLQIVSKQQALLIFDPKSSGSGPLTYPLSSTPLGFLIKNEIGALINESSKSFERDDKMFIKIQNPQYRISIEFKKKPVSLAGWEFENQIGEIISVSLNNIKTNDFISNEIFKTQKDYERIKK
tara:strand:- start:76 stop:690 length:615 start_codon:yes stop_codon:yes gene_type:complete